MIITETMGGSQPLANKQPINMQKGIAAEFRTEGGEDDSTPMGSTQLNTSANLTVHNPKVLEVCVDKEQGPDPHRAACDDEDSMSDMVTATA